MRASRSAVLVRLPKIHSPSYKLILSAASRVGDPPPKNDCFRLKKKKKKNKKRKFPSVQKQSTDAAAARRSKFFLARLQPLIFPPEVIAVARTISPPRIITLGVHLFVSSRISCSRTDLLRESMGERETDRRSSSAS